MSEKSSGPVRRAAMRMAQRPVMLAIPSTEGFRW